MATPSRRCASRMPASSASFFCALSAKHRVAPVDQTGRRYRSSAETRREGAIAASSHTVLFGRAELGEAGRQCVDLGKADVLAKRRRFRADLVAIDEQGRLAALRHEGKAEGERACAAHRGRACSAAS